MPWSVQCDRDDHVGADRQRRAGGDGEAGAGRQPDRPPARRAEVADHVEPDRPAASRRGWPIAGTRSSQRAAYPSIAAWSKAGNGCGREDVLGQHVAVRLGEVEVERRQRAQPAQHAAQVVGERRQLVARPRVGIGRQPVIRWCVTAVRADELGQPLAERRRPGRRACTASWTTACR